MDHALPSSASPEPEPEFARFLKLFWPLAHMGCALPAIKLIVIGLSVMLTACASVRVIDSDVRSFAPTTTTVAPGTYRFERLPSQQANSEGQQRLEAMAREAMAKVGLREAGAADAAVNYSAQVEAKINRNDRANPYDDLYDDGVLFGGIWGGLPGRDYVVTGRGQVIYTRAFPRIAQPYYQREVSVVLRDVKTNAVVFETRAQHDGVWSDSEKILPAMFEAALKDFPKASEGPRRVNIEIPR